MEEWLILAGVVLIASLLQTCTGYGFSIIGTPFLLLLYPAHTAIQINIILSICLSTVMIFSIAKEIDRTLLSLLVKGSAVGLAMGIFIYLYLDVRMLKVVIGGLILIVTVLLLLNITIRRSRNRDTLVGGLSGLLTTSIGVPGPPLLLYFSGTGMDKAVLRSTTLAFYLFVYSTSLIMMIVFGGTERKTWLSSLQALPALLIGIALGQLLFKWISPRLFRIVTYVILLLTGGYLLVTSL